MIKNKKNMFRFLMKLLASFHPHDVLTSMTLTSKKYVPSLTVQRNFEGSETLSMVKRTSDHILDDRKRIVYFARIQNKRYGMGFIDKCLQNDGIPQWDDDGVRLVCAKPREVYDEPVEILFRSDIEPMRFLGTEKERLARYFSNVYPETSKTFWNKMSLEELQRMYTDLEIWYDFPGFSEPQTARPKRAAKTKTFYRVPDRVELQQFINKPPQRDHTWIEVYHAGSMNTDFYIPKPLFAGTYYYPAKGSGVFLPLGKTLIAYNKVHALKKLRVPNDTILENAGPSFQRWYQRGIKSLSQHPEVTAEMAGKESLKEMVSKMVTGVNSTLDSHGKHCYFGLSDEGDHLLAFAAIQQGYDSIQLIREGQKGCDQDGVLVGFEIIHLRTPGESAKMLKRMVPDEYLVKVGDYQRGGGRRRK